ncbi:hypothetical protein HLH34_05445 [Gluconacetobacter azotocaptans]|uniref:Uncharacterized protein n=1 Tax=Gluconacetobacter azotocaptans TaxID=142834 RepID=A0A7W4JR89_9PROT|nr:hypothetical protein [Gluconacetobacter azotocaptans]MBB2189408.1 hypothetical protein [Gluconacetobacter azotocaptans]MBM9401197.1 hypothetical protein [Gluconacetobacter azotocaptans]GBQ34501.1 hypothetical protein AA13594_2881 [Gluconacetobacter azotocaptans DSM 13594]
MADTSAAAALASSMRAATTEMTHAAYRAAKPEHAAATGMNIVSRNVDGSTSSAQFDATGQIIPSTTSHKQNSATASFVNLLA